MYFLARKGTHGDIYSGLDSAELLHGWHIDFRTLHRRLVTHTKTEARAQVTPIRVPNLASNAISNTECPTEDLGSPLSNDHMPTTPWHTYILSGPRCARLPCLPSPTETQSAADQSNA